MNAERARQCLTELGYSADKAGQVAELMEADRLAEARRQLRCLRCGLMEELHACQRRVDQLDWLIRETERSAEAKR